ncbi:AraC family transcriptional regulator [Mesorhizobium sp.]|uniref:helix-turn-helix domain-containing protein n=1 Tax=Mesorhizobium sp. TaxID=1871066 RepID=UPI000FEA106D|nr:AraC family transcriptional regulator [Mesorhizobium sp.]RWK40631.1 MAG: AraC family transcriptional regulator [Mesorhizobium sp.]RWK65516.1 MAG: AraC family transcriptional regulator [Mesorhizobium sp.]RWK72301.1 MAG: AraC family transcriptional regulator [Mesorhizobium sp.]RWK77578.1 MAG: AraC family transcriptional regulator [Mesorhizobium sp.]RWL03176.1 MAG: AraC family transcriptional regulator [Mesorhizobium sp.]
MLFIPLPFVVAILLLILFVTVARRDDDAQPNVPFLALILVAAFQSTLLGLRWGYGMDGVGRILPVVAATVPPLVYGGVSGLVRKSDLSTLLRVGLHLIPAAGVVLLIALWGDAIDIGIALIFVGYAMAILLLMRSGADALRLAPFENAGSTYRAILFAASALLLSAAMDIFVFFDFAWTRGAHTPLLVTIANLAVLAVLSIAVATASRRGRPAQTVGITPRSETAEDRETIAAVQVLMETKRVYRDVDLNLDRLARKTGIPARRISAAINRATGKNVSQYVNDHRIAEACDLLTDTEKAVTEIMFDVGFLAKSNFNREFRRVTEMTPLEWRRKKAPSESLTT